MARPSARTSPIPMSAPTSNADSPVGATATESAADQVDSNMTKPTHHALVGTSVVNSGDRLASPVVVEHGFDDVRQDSDVGHAGGGRAPEVMKGPRRREIDG